MATATTAAPDIVPANTNHSDDLGIDRAFLMQMARIPFIALGWILASYLSHLIWTAIAPASLNYGPLIVICIGMVLAAVIDGWAFKVPNWLTLSLVLSGWGLGLIHTCGLAVRRRSRRNWRGALVYGHRIRPPVPAVGDCRHGSGRREDAYGIWRWIGAFFGGPNGLEILIWAFCLGAIVGGLCGIAMMIVRRKFKKNLSNFREIAVDLKVLATVGPGAAAARSSARRSGWDRLPYGIPLCIGFLGYLAYRYMEGKLPGMGQ